MGRRGQLIPFEPGRWDGVFVCLMSGQRKIDIQCTFTWDTGDALITFFPSNKNKCVYLDRYSYDLENCSTLLKKYLLYKYVHTLISMNVCTYILPY
jgi:hypothetical protein